MFPTLVSGQQLCCPISCPNWSILQFREFIVHLVCSYGLQKATICVVTHLYAFSAFNAHALGALAEVAGAGLNSHVGTILPALLIAMGDVDVVSYAFSVHS